MQAAIAPAPTGLFPASQVRRSLDPICPDGTNPSIGVNLSYGGSGSGAVGFRLVATRVIPQKMAQEIWHTNPQQGIGNYTHGANVSLQARGRWRGYYAEWYRVAWDYFSHYNNMQHGDELDHQYDDLSQEEWTSRPTGRAA